MVELGRKLYTEKVYAVALDMAKGALRLDPTNAGALALKNQAELSLNKRSETSESSYLEIIERLQKELEQANQKIADWEQKNTSFDTSSKPSKIQMPPKPSVTPSVSKPFVVDSWLVGNHPGERREIQIQGASYGFCWIPPGRFRRENGSNVRLTRGFWFLETPVTQGLWTAIMGNNPSAFCKTGSGSERVEGMDTTDFPVECVSWDDCQEYIKKLNGFNLVAGHKFRLPTEAEWEYACRAGTTTDFWWGDSLNGDRANCNGRYHFGTKKKGKYLERTCAVKSYEANPWGLYDVHGNVWEWCSDGYDAYPDGDVVDPEGNDNASPRVIRGGCWLIYAEYCRSADRDGSDPAYRDGNVGFRLLLE